MSHRGTQSQFAAADSCLFVGSQFQFVQIQIAPGASVGTIVCQCGGTPGRCTVSGPPSSTSSCSQMDGDGDDPCDPPGPPPPPHTEDLRVNKKSKKDKKPRKDKKKKKEKKMNKLSKGSEAKDDETRIAADTQRTTPTSSTNNDGAEIASSLTNTSPARGTKRKSIGEGHGSSEVGGLGGQLMITDGSVQGSGSLNSSIAAEVPPPAEPEEPQQVPGIPSVHDGADEGLLHEDASAAVVGVHSTLAHAGAAVDDVAAPSATPVPMPTPPTLLPLSSELELASPSGCRRSRFNVSLNLPENLADGVNLD